MEPDHHKVPREFDELQQLISSNESECQKCNCERSIFTVHKMNKSLKLEGRSKLSTIKVFRDNYTHELIFTNNICH